MKKIAWAVSAVSLSLLMQTSPALAGGGHGHHGHSYGGYHGNYYHGNSSSDAAIIAATLFGTAALVNAFTAPQYAPPPVAYYPPPPVVYYAPPPVVYYPAPVAYYPPPAVYYPRPYYYRRY